MERSKSFLSKTLNLIFVSKPKEDWGQGRIILERFKTNKLALFFLGIISLVFLIAFLGSNIRPDKTLNANNQIIEISLQKPGFKVWLFYPEGVPIKKGKIFNGLFFGSRRSSPPVQPIYKWFEKDGQIWGEPFSGENQLQSEKLILLGSTEKAKEKMQLKKYWLGTDNYGRDLLSRLMAGALISVLVGLISVFISLIIGLFLGVIAGYYSGWVDTIIMWFINVIWSIPTFLLVMAITLAFGKGFVVVFIAVGLTMWVDVARVARGQVMSIKEKEFVEAAKSMGFSTTRILFKHILPNIMGPIIVISAANFATAILLEAGLSFLGIGTQIPTPSWGNMIKSSYAYVTTDLAYLAILPGFCITILVLSFMVIGNALRDSLDSRS